MCTETNNGHLGAFISLQREELLCFNLSNGFKAGGLKGQLLFSLGYIFTSFLCRFAKFGRKKRFEMPGNYNHTGTEHSSVFCIFHNHNQPSTKSCVLSFYTLIWLFKFHLRSFENFESWNLNDSHTNIFVTRFQKNILYLFIPLYCLYLYLQCLYSFV